MAKRAIKSVLRGDFRISYINELYKSTYNDSIHEMVTDVPKKFRPGDKVRVTLELLKRERKEEGHVGR